MKKNKNKLVLIIVSLLIIVIVILLVFLLMPETEQKYSIDHINVENNMVDINKINDTVDTVDIPVVEELKEFEVIDYENLQDDVPIQEVAEKGSYEIYTVPEAEAAERVQINYYAEDCLQLINKNIIATDLDIELDTEAPLTLTRDYYGTEGYFRIFNVYNHELNKSEDKIAINLETGDMFGLTKQGLLYDYKDYPYNPEYIKWNEETDWDSYEPRATFDSVQLWDNLDAVIDYDKYPSNELRHFVDNEGLEYYKWTTPNSDNYILIGYYDGEMYQVVDGVKSSEITAFK